MGRLTLRALSTLSACATALVLFGCTSVSVDRALARFEATPYEQCWESGCARVRGQLVTPELQAALNLTRGSDVATRVSPATWDSAVAQARLSKGIAFRLRLEPQEKCVDSTYFHDGDVLMGFGRDAGQRDQAMREFTFGLESRVWIKINGVRVFPTMCHAEQNFGMENARNFWAMFNLSQEQRAALAKEKTVTLCFDQPLPGGGVAVVSWPVGVFRRLG